MKRFEEFIRAGIVRKIKTNQERAKSLLLEAERRRRSLQKRLEKLGIDLDNANDYIEHCYDLILPLIRARLYLDSYSASGLGAHEAEVSYLRIMGFTEKETVFIDQMRYLRNGILYYGTVLDVEYAEKVIKFTQEIYSRLKVLATVSPSMKIQETITATLQRLTSHRFLSLVPRGNTAIKLALSILPPALSALPQNLHPQHPSLQNSSPQDIPLQKPPHQNPTLLIPEEGGWLSYKSIPIKLGLAVEEVKCNDSRINLQDLRQKFLSKSNRYAAFLYQNPGGYFAQQPKEEIYELCRKNSCLVIMDVSGAIGTELCNGNYADIVVGSFGKWKLVDAGVGGFISAKEKKVWDRLDEPVKNTSVKNISLFEDPITLATIQQKLEELPQRIHSLTELRRKVIEELEQEKIEIVHRGDIGFVVVTRYADEQQKKKITNYCQSNNWEYTECPRYIRLNKPAISIEVKRK